MAEGAQDMDLGEFETKVDQMAAMINQLQESGRQNEAVEKLKQLMSTLVKVCPETAPTEVAMDATGDHAFEPDETFELEDTPEAIAESILTELVSKAVSNPVKKTKRSAKTRACKTQATPVKAQSNPEVIVKRKRGRPPKHLQAGIKAEKLARRKEFLDGKEDSDLGFANRSGRKRKNPNPQKLTVDDSDEDELIQAENAPQPDVDYTCDKCKDFTTKFVSKFIRHTRLHGDALLSCLNCQKDQYSMEEFKRHQCSKPTEPAKRKRPSMCTVCSTLFFSKKKFKDHMKTQHNITAPVEEGEIKPQFKCQYCEKAFSRKQTMFTHYKEHAGEQWVCQTCGDFSADFDAFTAHMTEHTRDSKFNCSKCGLSFQRKQQFEQHVSAHTKYDCNKCQKTFSTKKDLHRHERNEHGTKVPWQHKYHACDTCGKSYPRPGMLEVHKRIHTGERPLECPPCNLFFRTPKALSKHRQTFTHLQRSGTVGKEKRYLCSLCGKAYFRRQALLRHQKYHTGEKPYWCPHCEYRCPEANNLKRHMLLHFSSQRSFMCEICGSSFHAKKTLEMHHIYKHSENRQFMCPECTMSFKAANALRRHMRSHSSEKPFVCWCAASFNRQYNLRRHMKSVHGTDETLPPVRKVAVLDTPPEELAAKAEAEAEKEAAKVKGKRGRKSKLAQIATTNPVTQIQTITVEPHQQHYIIPSPNSQHHHITAEYTEQELHQQVMASLPRVIEDQALINSHLSNPDVQIHHVQLTEVHVQQPDMEGSSQTGAPTHVIVSAPDTHSLTSSVVSRPMSVPHPGYSIPVQQQQWHHMPIVMPTQVISSQHVQLEHDQHQLQLQQQQLHHHQHMQQQQVVHVSRSDTPTSQGTPVQPVGTPVPLGMPIVSRQVRQALTNMLHERPMSHPSAQSVVHHPQIHVSSGPIHPQHPPVLQTTTQHLQSSHHITYPEVTYTTSTEQPSKHMVLIPSIAPGTEVVSPQEEQFLVKAEQAAAMENLAQYQPGSTTTGYTGLPILLHQINTSN